MSTIKQVIAALDEARTMRSEQATEYHEIAEVSLTGGLEMPSSREAFLAALNAIPTTITIAEVTKSTCDAESASDRLINHAERRAAMPFNRAHRSF
jgi:hypothetical protein